MRLHDVEIDIRRQRKELKYLMDHFPMLPGRAQNNAKIACGLQPAHEWRHLDRLRAGANNYENLPHIQTRRAPWWRGSYKSAAINPGDFPIAAKKVHLILIGRLLIRFDVGMREANLSEKEQLMGKPLAHSKLGGGAREP